MQATGHIMIVEDDKDDCELLVVALTEAGVETEYLCFQNPAEALAYLKSATSNIHLIISDINMPLMNGLEFKKRINEDSRLRNKTIPFVFFSTSSSSRTIGDAYKLCIQGYFQKPNNVNLFNNVVRSIVEYWSSARHPVN